MDRRPWTWVVTLAVVALGFFLLYLATRSSHNCEPDCSHGKVFLVVAATAGLTTLAIGIATLARRRSPRA